MSRAGRIGLKVLYWVAVLAVSLVILVALILLIESRDKSNVDHGGGQSRAARHVSYPGVSPSPTSFANATIRCEAL